MRRVYKQLAEDLVMGQTEGAARAALETLGLTLRVVHRNGEELFRTFDQKADRVNVGVRDGQVVELVGFY